MGFHLGLGIFNKHLWGDGSDGDYAQDGGVVTFTGPRDYVNLTLTNNATYGPTNERAGLISGTGICSIDATSRLQARAKAGLGGGAAKAVVGGGNNGLSVGYPSNNLAGKWAGCAGVSGGAGGGGVTNAGGVSGNSIYASVYGYASEFMNATRSYVAGGVINGANGTSSVAPAIHADLSYLDIQSPLWGFWAGGAGGGGVDSIGTGAVTAVSGAGAAGGQGGGYLHIRFRHIQVAAAGGINANGADGANGGNATDSTDANGQAGGGGGGAGTGGNGGNGGDGIVAPLVLAA